MMMLDDPEKYVQSMARPLAIIFYLCLQIKCRAMERIVIEVEPKVALAWRRLTPARKKEITSRVGVRIGKEVLESSNEEYLAYLNELRTKMSERGLTQEILDEILNEPS
jgi:hypothetical protein